MFFHVRGTAGIAAFLPDWGSTGGAPGEPVQPGAEVLSGRRLSYGQVQFQESPESCVPGGQGQPVPNDRLDAIAVDTGPGK